MIKEPALPLNLSTLLDTPRIDAKVERLVLGEDIGGVNESQVSSIKDDVDGVNDSGNVTEDSKHWTGSGGSDNFGLVALELRIILLTTVGPKELAKSSNKVSLRMFTKLLRFARKLENRNLI